MAAHIDVEALASFLLARYDDEEHAKMSRGLLADLLPIGRDLEAKRAIVDYALGCERTFNENLDLDGPGGCAYAMTNVLHLMAAPFADHPDCLPEWRPMTRADA